jgi:hypothetical protein
MEKLGKEMATNQERQNRVGGSIPKSRESKLHHTERGIIRVSV